MPDEVYPRLCGGTFFLQLLRMKKPSSRSKGDGRLGEKDSVNNQRVLEALIRFFSPDFAVYADNTFKGDTSDYRACKATTGDNLPFDDSRTDFSRFDLLIKSNYEVAQKKMISFVSKYIRDDNADIVEKVTRALLQLIADDKSIKDDDEFYMGLMGNPIKKENLIQQSEIILEPFLLGIWHFILLNRPNNYIGRDTFLSWNYQEGPNKPWKYKSAIGERYPTLRVRRVSKSPIIAYSRLLDEDDAPQDIKDEVLEEDQEEYTSQPENDPVDKMFRTVFFNQNIFNNYGTVVKFEQNAEKIYYIDHVDHLD